jgi:hypothetical protein
VENDPNLIMGYKNATISANFNEYSRLCAKILQVKPTLIPEMDSESESLPAGIDAHVEIAKKLAAR